MTTTAQQTNITATVTVTDVAAARLILLAGGKPRRCGGWDINGVHYATDEALTVALYEIAANDLGR